MGLKNNFYLKIPLTYTIGTIFSRVPFKCNPRTISLTAVFFEVCHSSYALNIFSISLYRPLKNQLFLISKFMNEKPHCSFGYLRKIDNLGNYLLTILGVLTNLPAQTVFYKFSSTVKPPLKIIFIFSFDSTITTSIICLTSSSL